MESSKGALEGKVALVTGSAAGIGEAIVRRLRREGARVMVHGRETEREAASRIVAELAGGKPEEVGLHLGDLIDPEVCTGLIAAVIARFGKLDILVNNAAISERSNLETTDVATFDRIMATNLRAPLLLARAALPHFRQQGGGTILNIGSINGYCGEENLLAYSISKGGLMTLSRNLADAHGREGLRVHHLNLGWTLTPNEHALKIREGLPEDWPSRIPRGFAPSGRLLKPEEIAHFVLAFVSDQGLAINGSVVDLEQFPVIGRNAPKSAE